jgi:hypothetical protein
VSSRIGSGGLRLRVVCAPPRSGVLAGTHTRHSPFRHTPLLSPLPIRTITASLRPWQAGCHHTELPRLRPRPRTGAQQPVQGWPKVAWDNTRRPETANRPSVDGSAPVWSEATAPLTAVPAEASGTFNPLHGVLCILPSLYLCAIGPRSVFFLAMDTPRTSNCSPKPLYSGMRSTAPQWVVARIQRGGR